MKDYKFEIMALDSEFNIVSLLRYINLQWTRKFYESGTFSIQIPISQYDTSFKYIYTKDRPEVGEISQINFIDNATVSLSGYFLEEKLNNMICYQLPSVTNITNGPSWVSKEGAAEDVAIDFFNAFKELTFDKDGEEISCALDIQSSESQGRGEVTEQTRGGEGLGDKLHTILRPSLMSYRVKYNLAENIRALEIVKGLDCTQDNTENNNPVVFSTRYGNLMNTDVLVSDTDYKNAFISYVEKQDGTIIVEAISERKEEDSEDRFIAINPNMNSSDYTSDEAFINAIITQSKNELETHSSTISIDFDAVAGSYEYMTDFDIGYRCSIVINELGISKDTVLTECSEVIKDGVWSLSLEFEAYEFTLNTSTKTFHRPACSTLSHANKNNIAKTSMTVGELIRLGYKPCNVCNPA